jgi:hypothetical protein
MTHSAIALTALLLASPFLVPAAEVVPLISTNANWRMFKGRTEASAPVSAWREIGFNDAAFTNTPAPFTYGEGYLYGTVMSDMLNQYSCFFLRRTFEVTNSAAIAALRFGAKVDDGYVVWINGTELLRENMAGVAGDPVSIATLSTGAPSEPVPFTFYNLPVPASLVNGTNVIAVQVFNTTLASSDIVFDCSLESIGIDTVPPSIVSVTPAPGSVMTNLTQIVVEFSEPVTGLSADELSVAGIGATGLSVNGNIYTFTFPPAPYGNVPITWVTGHGITDLAIPPNAFNENLPGASWAYTLVDVVPPTVTGTFPPAGATVQALGQIDVTFNEAVLGLNAADLLINGQAATNVIAQIGATYSFQFAPQPNGPVSIMWVSGHGIIDTAPAPNAFAGGSWSYTVDANANTYGIIINEINVSNEKGLTDEDGDEEDWIELYNAGTSPIDLFNWSLSDDLEEPGRWLFPHKVVQPGQYLVLFASGKDRQSPTGTNRFHTNFKLSGDGEFLGLFTPDSPRQMASGFAPKFPKQRNDNSYGPDANGNLRYFGTPTPGASNGMSTITGVVEPVHFSTARGHFSQPFDLTLSCITRGTVIRYTTNGSEPTDLNGQIYFNPLRVSNTLIIRAAAFRTDFLPSSVATHTYLFNQSAAIRSLPVVSVQTASNNLSGPTGIIGMNGGSGPPANPWVPSSPPVPGEYHNFTKTGIAWEKPVSVEFIKSADNSGFQVDGGIRVQGSDYTRPRYAPTDKISYRLYFRGDYGSGRLEYPFFADAVVQSFDQIVMRAGHNDISNPFLRDELARQLHTDMGQVACHGTWVAYFLNGVYKGYYNPTERVEEGFLQSWHGGSNSWDILTVGSAVQGGDNVAWNSMRTYISSQDVTQPAVYTEIQRRLDVVNFIDYLIVNVYGCTWDWPHNNWRAARERAPGGKFRFYVWDAEGAFGEFDGRTALSDSFTGVTSPLVNGTAEIPTLYTRLRNSAEFRLLWADRVHKHFFNGGAMTDTNIANRFIQMRAELIGVIPNLSGNILNNFIPQRRAPLMTQFNNYGLLASSNAPIFNQHGSNVPPGFNLTMTSTNIGGTIYYTTNGDDPRVMFSGAVSNSAVAYTGPVTLNQSMVVKARTLNGTNWSALTEASFAVATRGVPLRITEINYNPLAANNPSAYEFIELQNVGTGPIDLSSMFFDGVTYTFPIGATLAGGARLVLASDIDPDAFAARYPGVTVRGYYSGSLNNGGERIVLKDAGGNIITSLDYSDGGGWPRAADGGGSSLEIINPYGDPDDPANWRASATTGGTPGSANASPGLSNVRLNEILAENVSALNHSGTFPDFVELANAGGAPVDLTGWGLTDDGNTHKFLFPPGTSVAAGGYLVVWCDAITNTTPGLHSGFAFGRNGDNVFLYDANTNLIDALSFGLQLTDYSLGRIGNGWTLTTPTANAANVAAAMGNVASLSINEFLANPVPGQNDWIELFNNSALPVGLNGTFMATTSTVHQITSRSFVPPFGFVQLFADEGVGAEHLDLKLPATGGTISLYDAAANEVNRITYPAQTEGITRGRLPDGTASIVNFPGTESPGASNYTASYTGPVVNEILARNASAVTNAAGRVADYIELFNPGVSGASLAGMSLSVNSAQPGDWRFPPDATISAGGYLIIWCDGGAPVSTNSTGYNTGQSLDGESGGVYLFNPAGQLVNSVEYGFQVTDRSIGLGGSIWRLLAAPTPGAVNGAAATLGPNTALRLNEWMAQSPDGPDWFEIFNPTNLPVDMTRMVLTDDPTTSGTNEFRVPPLSFIDAGGFVQFLADSAPEQGRNHVSFDLDSEGESIRLYATNGSTIIDTVAFGLQPLGVSQGRIPDGFTNSISFPGSATPGEPNYRLINGIAVNEVLTHAFTALGQLIELSNSRAETVNIGGWFLSDSASAPKKFRIPDGRTIPANGFGVFQESEFHTGPNSFSFDRARGGELWLSEADAAGNLTGFRTGVRFGAAANNVSFGRYGSEFVAQSARTFGALNAGPLVGPIVINEIMYHPLEGIVGATEFIELRNVSGASVDLFDPARPGNTWRLSDGIEFAFPPGTSLSAGSYLLVVDFDPVAEPSALAAFRGLHGISPAVPVFGPYIGRLDNAGEAIELLKPDLPDGTFVPYVLVEKVAYRDSSPWPSGAVDGGGFSLQRRTGNAYGNDPANWLAAPPTVGGANATGGATPPVIVQSPASTNVLVNTDLLLQAVAAGAEPFFWQWRFNGVELPGETNAALFIDHLRLGDSGAYDAYVVNPGGPAFSAAAQVIVVEPPMIFAAPPNYITTNGGSNITFTVSAGGTPPLRYQWQFNGADIPGAIASSLSLTNVSIDRSGVYSLTISNAYGVASTNLTFVVLVRPAFVLQPQSQTVLEGGTAVFTALAAPNHPLAPLYYRWIRNGVGVQTSAVPVIVFTNVQLGLPNPVPIRCAVTNFATGVGGVNSATVNMTVLADFDRDGMADSWEVQYGFNTNNVADGGLDLDGDGMINRHEYGAGTNPSDPLSILKLVLTATNAAALEFVAQANLNYAVQYRTNLSSALWNTLTSISAQSSVRTVQVNTPNPPVERERYYRIVTPPPIVP